MPASDSIHSAARLLKINITCSSPWHARMLHRLRSGSASRWSAASRVSEAPRNSSAGPSLCAYGQARTAETGKCLSESPSRERADVTRCCVAAARHDALVTPARQSPEPAPGQVKTEASSGPCACGDRDDAARANHCEKSDLKRHRCLESRKGKARKRQGERPKHAMRESTEGAPFGAQSRRRKTALPKAP